MRFRELTLRTVLDLEGLLLALARSRLVATGSLDTVDGIDAALAQPLGVLEQQPLDRALLVSSRAGRAWCIGFVELADDGHGKGRRELVQCEDGRGSREEVVPDHVLIAE